MWASKRSRTCYRQIAVLLTLYVIQAVPMGLSAAIPLILQSRGASYTSIAKYGFASIPFSLKLLWAPLVDSLRLPFAGRRKSWMIPTQILCGLLMVCVGGSGALSRWTGEIGGKESIRIWPLTGFFFVLYLSMATQDIAVDGWALEILPVDKKKHASTCNSIGQSIGYYCTYIVFIILNDPGTCNKYLRSEPKDRGLVSLGGFLQAWGFIILGVTAYVAFFEPEGDAGTSDESSSSLCTQAIGVSESVAVSLAKESVEPDLTVGETYRLLSRMIKNRSVQTALLLLFTIRIAFAATEAEGLLKTLEAGLAKEQVALLAPLVLPWGVLSSFLGGRMIGRYSPLQTLTFGYCGRLVMVLIWAGAFLFIRDVYTPYLKDDDSTSLGLILFWIALYLLVASQQVCSEFMFVSQLAFFAQISDIKFGGTYMTFLNTIANLGNKWPGMVALFLLNKSSFFGIDGFICQSCICFSIGIVWISTIGRHLLRKLQHTPPECWIFESEFPSSGPSGPAEVEFSGEKSSLDPKSNDQLSRKRLKRGAVGANLPAASIYWRELAQAQKVSI